MSRHLIADHIISNFRAGVLAIDARQHVLLINDAARAILSLDRAALEGKPIQEVLSDHPGLMTFLSDALTRRLLIDRTEVQLTGRHPLTLGITVTPVAQANGCPEGIVVLFKDLTRIERMEEQAQLKDRLAALGHMAAGLAHEMRNPLASIRVTVDLLRKTSAADSDLDRKLRSILGDVQRLNQSVTDCLAFARPIRVEPQFVQIDDVLEKVLNQVVSLEHTHPFQTIRQFAPDLPRTWVDPQQLEIVFFNLLNNAIDAVRHRRGTIRISTGVERGAQGHDALVVMIADNGEGIPPDRLPKVFMPFFTTKGKGSGLGLANVKKIVDHLHGTIDATSEPGVETRFSVRIPVLDTPAGEAQAA